MAPQHPQPSSQTSYLQPPQQYPAFQPPQQHVEQKHYTQDPGEMTQQFSTMQLTPQHSLTPQSSTESTSDPPGYTAQPQQVS